MSLQKGSTIGGEDSGPGHRWSCWPFTEGRPQTGAGGCRCVSAVEGGEGWPVGLHEGRHMFHLCIFTTGKMLRKYLPNE